MIFQVGEDPCGWCGLDGCRTVLTKKGKKQSTASDCEYHHARMSFSSARSSSAASPSTNIPIHCTLCKPHPTTVWKYNILSHLISEHAYLKPLESGVHLPSLPNDMWLDMYICYQEESAMVRRTAKEGISRTDVNAIRADLCIPGSDMIEEVVQELQQNREALSGRKRALTGASTGARNPHRPYKRPLLS